MRSRTIQQGMALISAMLLLLVTTILGVAMFRSFGLLEVIAGNTREKQRALHAAESAQSFGEWWLTSSQAVNATTGQPCTGLVTDITKATVCSNPLTIANASSLSSYGIGVVYSSPTLPTGNPGTVGNYVSDPVFYISFLNTSYNQTTGTSLSSYQVDALGYGGNTSSAAIAESTYNVGITYTAQKGLAKFLNLGGP